MPTIEVTRPKPAPVKLRKLAREAGMEPRDYLVDLLSRHASFADAAREIGVWRETLRLWRARYGISVRVADE